jgi:hypothetical protein
MLAGTLCCERSIADLDVSLALITPTKVSLRPAGWTDNISRSFELLFQQERGRADGFILWRTKTHKRHRQLSVTVGGEPSVHLN